MSLSEGDLEQIVTICKRAAETCRKLADFFDDNAKNARKYNAEDPKIGEIMDKSGIKPEEIMSLIGLLAYFCD